MLLTSDLPNPKILDSAGSELESYFQIRTRPNPSPNILAIKIQ